MVNEYLQDSSIINNFINDRYIKTDSCKDIIKVHEMYELYKLSDSFICLNKAEKRRFVRANQQGVGAAKPAVATHTDQNRALIEAEANDRRLTIPPHDLGLDERTTRQR